MAVVLITGCSSGIGLETALAFARRGDVTYASMRNMAKAGSLQSRADAEGLSLEVVTLDVTDDASVTTAVAAVEAAHGGLDALVNNAGVGYAVPSRRSRWTGRERCSRPTCGVRCVCRGPCCEACGHVVVV